jgi:protein TonB
MIIVRRLVMLVASAALHLAAIGGLLLIAGAGSPIVVDLVAHISGEVTDEARLRTEPRSVVVKAETPRHVRASRPAPASAPDDSPAQTPPMTVDSIAQEPALLPAAPILAEARPPEPPAENAPVVAPNETGPSPLTSTSDASTRDDAAGGAAAHLVEGAGAQAPAGGPPGSALTDAAASDRVKSSGGDSSPVAATTPGDARGGIPPEYGPYLRRFRRRVQESINYPLAARRQGIAGTVELEVLLSPSGRIAGVTVVASSSHALLDQAALDAVRRLAPEPIPEPLPRRPLRILLPLAFELQ